MNTDQSTAVTEMASSTTTVDPVMSKKPKQGYFRWQGLLGFVIILGLLMTFLFFYAGHLIKVGIERGGSWYWGAEVNVAEVTVNWSPFKVAVLGMQVTDPDQPSQNLFSFAEANASVDLWQILMGKTLIPELLIDQVKVHQPRAKPGAVTRVATEAPTSTTEGSIMEQSMAALPSVKDILAQSDFRITKAAMQLQQTYKDEQAALKPLLQHLPDKPKIVEYQGMVKQITDTKITKPEQLATLKTQLDQLKTQFKADKAQLDLVKAQLQQSKAAISDALTALKAAPAQDWQDLEQRYPLNDTGVQNLTEQLFGPQVREYYQLARKGYRLIKPMLDKFNQAKAAEVPQHDAAQGRYVHFVEDDPLPAWLVQQAQINLDLEQGLFFLEINELTAEHWLRHKSTQLTVRSANVNGSATLALNGRMSLDPQGVATTQFEWQMLGMGLKQLTLSDSKSLQVNLTQAILDVKGTLSSVGDQIDNQNQLKLRDSKINGQGANKMNQIAVNLLSQLNELAIDIKASGPVDALDMAVSSDLDKKFYAAIKQELQATLTRFKTETQAGLQQKLIESLKLNEGEAQQLQATELSLDGLEKSLEVLLKSQLGNKVEDTIKDKLKQLGGKFGV